MYKYTYGLLPTSFNGIFQKLHTHERNLNYITTVDKSRFVKSIPTSHMPKSWNSLKLEIKRSSSIDTVIRKRRVKCGFTCEWNRATSPPKVLDQTTDQ